MRRPWSFGKAPLKVASRPWMGHPRGGFSVRGLVVWATRPPRAASMGHPIFVVNALSGPPAHPPVSKLRCGPLM
jgi:hypothetical protein